MLFVWTKSRLVARIRVFVNVNVCVESAASKAPLSELIVPVIAETVTAELLTVPDADSNPYTYEELNVIPDVPAKVSVVDASIAIVDVDVIDIVVVDTAN